MEIVDIHHVLLGMPPGRKPEAQAFYEGLLGVPRVVKPSHLDKRGGCWFEKGDVRIHLGVEEGSQPARKTHLALLVTGLAGLRDRLERAGLAVVIDQPLPGYDRCYISDPFGNRIELLEPDS